MRAEGRVDRIEGGLAVVTLTGTGGGCGRCAQPGGCGSELLTQAFGRRCTCFRVPDTIGARPGESVVLELPESSVTRAAGVVYLMPVVFVILGAALGVAAGGTDAGAAAGAAAGLAASLAGVLAFHRMASSDPRYRPVLCRPDIH